MGGARAARALVRRQVSLRRAATRRHEKGAAGARLARRARALRQPRAGDLPPPLLCRVAWAGRRRRRGRRGDRGKGHPGGAPPSHHLPISPSYLLHEAGEAKAIPAVRRPLPPLHAAHSQRRDPPFTARELRAQASTRGGGQQPLRRRAPRGTCPHVAGRARVVHSDGEDSSTEPPNAADARRHARRRRVHVRARCVRRDARRRRARAAQRLRRSVLATPMAHST